MNRHLRSALCAFACAACAPSVTAAEFDATRWSHRAAIELTGIAAPGLAEFSLTPAVHDAARADLADIRIVDAAGKETPYVLARPAAEPAVKSLVAAVYNRTSLPGSHTATADFGAKIPKTRVDIAVQGVNFRREVFVEGCDDGTSWQVVRNGAFLFRVERSADSAGYDKNAVAIPPNDFRYLRITVRHGEDEAGGAEIDGVTAWQIVQAPRESVGVVIARQDVTERTVDRATEIALDLAWRNLPLHEIALEFAEENFFRHVSVSGRNAEEHTMRTMTEDGSTIEKQVEAPWIPFGSAAIYRYTSGGNVDQSLTVSVADAACRFIRLHIQNRDDAPLTFTGATVSRLVRRVAFQPKMSGGYTLFVGNPDAHRPSYDLASYAERLRKDGVTDARLADVLADSEFGRAARVVPWSERHAWLLWVALVAVGAVLAMMVWRQAKAAESGADGSPKEPPPTA